eukprot:CAMPEP_0206539260 /NCGR_PEP_ID=MMETSP0325_2-20121206/8336_1 /ASSEMBLY_ACC=CAM_ASM_000347 /TAXON_ID=2866 /ORGANISM="Crypthecodinium cohnii, Strain Seligo" /LENGTH=113 /DNA_ID=CAMNT_0054036823 /DNA_START=83 /DNA_END=422 /DNA_ORIENTATION=+
MTLWTVFTTRSPVTSTRDASVPLGLQSRRDVRRCNVRLLICLGFLLDEQAQLWASEKAPSATMGGVLTLPTKPQKGPSCDVQLERSLTRGSNGQASPHRTLLESASPPGLLEW